ncbi:hypothetical protein MMC25_008295 [Agyrium rufum]|nr:hypothetical protein [Agyrium rufum]
MSYNTNTDILIAGAFAAFTIDLLVYPLDTIKTRVQSPSYTQLYKNAATGQINRALFRGLYQGIGSVILATVPSSGAFFTTYEATKSLLSSIPATSGASSKDGDGTFLPAPVINSLASSTGEIVSCFILTPAEVLKQNAQVVVHDRPTNGAGAQQKAPLFDTRATKLALSKFRSQPTHLWRGYTALVARNLPFTAMQFPMFEYLKGRILDYRESKGYRREGPGGLFERGLITGIAAGSAGSVAAVITTPVDVVKTRIMLSAAGSGDQKPDEGAAQQVGRKFPAASTEAARKGGWAVGKEVLAKEGIKGLFRGGALRAGWTALGSGLYLGVYESGRKFLEERRTAGHANDGPSIV